MAGADLIPIMDPDIIRDLEDLTDRNRYIRHLMQLNCMAETEDPEPMDIFRHRGPPLLSMEVPADLRMEDRADP